ncbi:MAG TPA: hypothetical protein IGS52_13395 [Oscillatoriaceae cyanobacterium M33_DOE_052]|nr:hypothetical protein [Oscillatoriaceae cyanobacterium M33_DOE_052]
MNDYRQEIHKAAEKAFMDALEKLEETFEEVEEVEVPPPPKPASKTDKKETRRAPAFDLQELEDAAADIERYMASLHKSEES